MYPVRVKVCPYRGPPKIGLTAGATIAGNVVMVTLKRPVERPIPIVDGLAPGEGLSSRSGAGCGLLPVSLFAHIDASPERRRRSSRLAAYGLGCGLTHGDRILPDIRGRTMVMGRPGRLRYRRDTSAWLRKS